MKLSRLFALASVCSLSLAASAVFASDTEAVSTDAPAATCPSKGTCSEGACSESKLAAAEASACSSTCSSDCKVTAAMAKLPAMTFMVGDEETCCSDSAASMAKSADQPIQFKVGEETFATKQEAFATLVSKTEEMVNAFTTPSTCSVSGMTTVAGKSCHCPTEAGTLAAKVSQATQLVSMKYKVGDETCSCPMSAKAMAKKAGVTPTYVVAGTETPCEMTARLALAREKYKAALIALAPSDDASSEG